MTETTTNANQSFPNATPAGENPAFLHLFEGLAAAGARFGITLGKIGLQQASKTLESTASFLGEVAGKLEKVGEKFKADETPKA